jgi:hypothetical protein
VTQADSRADRWWSGTGSNCRPSAFQLAGHIIDCGLKGAPQQVRLALPPRVAQRDKRTHCNWFEQLHNAEYLQIFDQIVEAVTVRRSTIRLACPQHPLSTVLLSLSRKVRGGIQLEPRADHVSCCAQFVWIGVHPQLQGSVRVRLSMLQGSAMPPLGFRPY